MLYFLTMYIYPFHFIVPISPVITLSSSSGTIVAFFYPFIFQYFVYVLIYRIYNFVNSEVVLMSIIKSYLGMLGSSYSTFDQFKY